MYKIISPLDVIVVTCSPKNRATSTFTPRSPLVLHPIHVTLHIAYDTVYVKHKQVSTMFSKPRHTKKDAQFNSNPIPSSTSRDMNWSHSDMHHQKSPSLSGVAMQCQLHFWLRREFNSIIEYLQHR